MPTVFPPGLGDRIARAIAYGFISVTGFVVLANAGTSHAMQQGLGWAALLWAVFMITAVPAAVAAFYGRYIVEYVLLPFFGVALLLAIGIAWFFVINDPTLLPRLAASSALWLLLLNRFLILNRVLRVPKDERKSWTPRLPRQSA